MKRLVVLVLGGGRGTRLYPLTKYRSKPAVPIAGEYRLIDVPLSNCLNSGLNRIYVLTQFNSVSLHRHIRNTYNFDQFSKGFVEILAAQQTNDHSNWYQGTADAVRHNLRYVEEPGIEYVLILSGDQLYRMDYRDMIATHERSGADVTIAAVAVYSHQASGLGIMRLDDHGRVIGFLEKPQTPEELDHVRVSPQWIDERGIPSRGRDCLANMGIYIFNTEVLVQEVIRDARLPESDHDFGKNIIPSMVQRAMRVYSYSFKDENKKEVLYWRDIGRIDAYFEANMDLVTIDPVFNLYDPAWPIRTYQRQCPPAKTIFGGDPGHIRSAVVEDSLIANGCIISGATVQRSILSPNVRVDYYAEVADAILFDDVHIGPRARVRRAIIEDGVKVPAGYTIGYNRELDARRFPISDGGVVIVPNNIELQEE